MSDPDLHPDLAGLLRGELANDAVLDAEDHLHTCPRCQRDLPELVTGHALLRRAASALGRQEDAPPVPALTLPRHHSGRARLWLATGAAAALVAAVGLGVTLGIIFAGSSDDEPGVTPPTAVPLAVDAPLAPIDGDGAGAVQMSAPADRSTQVTVSTSGLPTAPRGGFYYVWLLDPATNKMLPLGLVEPGGSSTFRIDADLVASYGAVDVSLEADDGDPGHSLTSVLRGTYDLT